MKAIGEPANDYAESIRAKLPPRMLLDPIPFDLEGRYSRKQCSVYGCPRVSRRKDQDLCRLHGEAFVSTGETDWRAWAGTAAIRAVHSDSVSTLGLFDVAAAGTQVVRDELAYGLHRRGEKNRPTKPEIVNRLARGLAKRRIGTIADLRHDGILIEEVVADCGGNRDGARAFLLDTLDEICILTGVEPTRRYLGVAAAGGGAYVNLNSVENDEFRRTIERWMSYRLASEISSAQRTQAVVSWVVQFVEWLDRRGIRSWPQVNRDVLIDYLVVVKSMKAANGDPLTDKYRGMIVGGIGVFLDECATNGWAAIPPGTKWLRGEKPRGGRPVPRLMGKMTAARLRTPGNLALVGDPDCRLAIQIMASTGLRRKDVCAGFAMDCLLDLGDNKWSVVYFNSKAKEEKTAPITPELADAIRAHITYKRAKFPDARMLFSRDNKGTVITLTIVNAELRKLIDALELTDTAGNTVNVTPHMFRHQNATEWLEKGVSLPAIKELLGHASMTTTEIYAHMSTTMVREQWEKSQAVNSEGEMLYSPGSMEMEAAWMHAFLGGATQALPNGRCGMPCSEECEHANACLYCPLFITTPEYLPVLRDQRDEHETMMKLAEEAGHQRIVERNRKPFFALSKLIARLEKIEDQSQGV